MRETVCCLCNSDGTELNSIQIKILIYVNGFEKSKHLEKLKLLLKLPWIGNSSLRFESQIKQAITNCAVNPRVVYSTKKALPSIQKDCVPATQKSSVVYEFTCQCDSGYVGRTTQRLEDRIKQHVPSHIRNKTHPKREQPPRSCKTKITTKTCDSAIGQHLLENPDCAKKL